MTALNDSGFPRMVSIEITSALGFGHLRERLFRPAFHLFRRNIFHMLAQRPAVAERILDLPVAVAPELIG